MIFFETSAKTSNNVYEMFLKSAEQVTEKVNNKIIDPKNQIYGVKMGRNYYQNMLDRKSNKKKKCC